MRQKKHKGNKAYIFFVSSSFSWYFFFLKLIFRRPIPILEAADDGNEDPEVDLVPLLYHPEENTQQPSKMIHNNLLCLWVCPLRLYGQEEDQITVRNKT